MRRQLMHAARFVLTCLADSRQWHNVWHIADIVQKCLSRCFSVASLLCFTLAAVHHHLSLHQHLRLTVLVLPQMMYALSLCSGPTWAGCSTLMQSSRRHCASPRLLGWAVYV